MAISDSVADCIFWDFAGVDGLQAAIALFSPAISHISPFQSLTANVSHQPCSVLRLCENNFRVALPKELAEEMAFDNAIANLNLKVWVKRCPAATFIVPTELALSYLPQIATTKPIYSLTPFPCDRAVPACINGVAILAWHYLWDEQPRVSIQTASANVDEIRRAFSL